MYFTTFVLSALPLLVDASLSQRDGLSIPLSKYSVSRNADGVVDGAKLHAHLQRTVAKYERGFHAFERNTREPHPLAPKPAVRRSNHRHGSSHHRGGAGVSLTDLHEEMWSGEITVGTPPQTFNVIVATGSSDLYIPDVSCASSKFCQGHARYDHSKSTTAKAVGKPFTIEYGDNSTVGGKQYTDTVTIAGFSAIGQTFGSATHFSTNFQPLPVDGILGLGLPEYRSFGPSPIIQTLVDGSELPNPVFALYLNNSGSELFVGGANMRHHTGPFTYVPVIKESGLWMVEADGLKVNGKYLLGKTDVVLESGTSLLLGSPNDVKALYKMIPGSKLHNESWYEYPCNREVDISFTFNGCEVKISPSALNYGQVSKDSEYCLGGIASAGADYGFWIGGDVFMRNVYTKFDYGKMRIGFAQLPHNAQ